MNYLIDSSFLTELLALSIVFFDEMLSVWDVFISDLPEFELFNLGRGTGTFLYFFVNETPEVLLV